MGQRELIFLSLSMTTSQHRKELKLPFPAGAGTENTHRGAVVLTGQFSCGHWAGRCPGQIFDQQQVKGGQRGGTSGWYALKVPVVSL